MEDAMDVQGFQSIVQPVLDLVAGQRPGSVLAARLTEAFPPEGETFLAIERACHDAIAAGWMCSQGGPGRRFGRVIEPSAASGQLSVDVVDLEDIKGPHHRHPTGEVCMVMPVTETAEFDGNPRGWCAYEPGSDHHPTVTGGEALVLYMLPDGEIEFTGR
jgi:hypothetical protein